MRAVTYPPANPFVVPDDHPDREAHGWLAGQLDWLDWASEPDYWWTGRQVEPLLQMLNEQPGAFQIGVLKACLERMSWHGQQPTYEGGLLTTDYYIGSVLYHLACGLYQRRLPYSEEDICRILRLSRHTCGHGGDVTPPFDIAVAYARANGIGPDLLSALRDFMDGLTGIAAAQVTHLKCRAGLLFILDAETGRARQRCWSDRFRAGVLALPDEEQARWRQLVLGMAANQVYEMPRVWRQEASRFLESLSPEVVVQRLAAWWPDPRVSTVWPIQTAGGHLLKYLIWLLGVAADVGDLRPQCLDLVCRLSELDWKPRERGQKVMVTAAFYLRSIPVEISWPALQRLARWSSLAPGGSEEGKINEILQRYCREHELELPALEPAEVAGR